MAQRACVDRLRGLVGELRDADSHDTGRLRLWCCRRVGVELGELQFVGIAQRLRHVANVHRGVQSRRDLEECRIERRLLELGDLHRRHDGFAVFSRDRGRVSDREAEHFGVAVAGGPDLIGTGAGGSWLFRTYRLLGQCGRRVDIPAVSFDPLPRRVACARHRLLVDHGLHVTGLQTERRLPLPGVHDGGGHDDDALGFRSRRGHTGHDRRWRRSFRGDEICVGGLADLNRAFLVVLPEQHHLLELEALPFAFDVGERFRLHVAGAVHRLVPDILRRRRSRCFSGLRRGRLLRGRFSRRRLGLWGCRLGSRRSGRRLLGLALCGG